MPIICYDEDVEGINISHHDVLIIASYIDHVKVQHVLVDVGVSTNVLSLMTCSALGWEITQLRKCTTPLVSFATNMVMVEGCMIDLPDVIIIG